jgi:glucose 1-dehydrogenase
MSERDDAPAAQGFGRLRGQTALVTGSTRGLGRTIAEWLARDGADIVVSGRDEDEVRDSAAAIQALGVETHGIAADLARVEEAHRLATATLARVERLDILVNNAGMSIAQPFWEATDDEVETQLNVNWRSPFVLGQHVAKHMMAQGIRGRIVNISTVGVHAAHPDRLVYNAAKAAIEAMTSNMAHELAPHGIRVNAVAPGNMVERPGVDADPDANARYARQIPVGRVGRAEDIAAAVRFFCLPESDFTTGQTLLVDGGMIGYLREE